MGKFEKAQKLTDCFLIRSSALHGHCADAALAMLTDLKAAVGVTGIIIIAIGFLLILGTAGASDLGDIGFRQIISQTVMGLGISTVGFIIIKIVNKLEA